MHYPKYWILVVLLIFCLGFVSYFMLPAHKAILKSPNEDLDSSVNTTGSVQASKSLKRNVLAFAPRYVPFTEQSIPAKLILAEGEWIMAGTVRSEEGYPLAGATVSLYPYAPREPDYKWPSELLTKTCDREGHYVLRMDSPLKNAIIRIGTEGHRTLLDLTNIEIPRNLQKDYTLNKASGCIEGSVLNGETPMPGARIRSIADESVYTDDRGRYILEGLPEKRIWIYADAPGFLSKSISTAASSRPCGHLDFKFTAGSQISFETKNRYGEPIFGAVIQTREHEGEQFGTSTQNYKDEFGNIEQIMQPRTRSDKRGRVALTVPKEPSVLECKVSATGYKPLIISIDTKKPPSEIILETIESQISGIVFSATGIPVPAADVRVFVTNSTNMAQMTGSKEGKAESAMPDTRTDAIGRFSVAMIYPRLTEIRVKKKGFTERQILFDTGQLNTKFYEIQLEACDTGVFGKVLDFEGKPAKQFMIGFYVSNSQNRSSFIREISSEGGEFFVDDVPQGIYDILIQAKTAKSVQNVWINGVELKPKYYCGQILVQLKELVENIK